MKPNYDLSNLKRWSLNRIQKFLLMLFTISTLSTSDVVSREVWRVTLDPPLSGQYTSIKVASDGAYYRFMWWTGYDMEAGENKYYYNLIRITPDGEIDWEINEQGPSYFSDMFVDLSGNVYLTGQQHIFAELQYPVLRKYSPSGNLLIDKIYTIPILLFENPVYAIQNIDKNGNITFTGNNLHQYGDCGYSQGWIGGGLNNGNRTWALEIGEPTHNVLSIQPETVQNDDIGGSMFFYIEHLNNCTDWNNNCWVIQGCIEEIDSFLIKIDGNGNIQSKINENNFDIEKYFLAPSGNVYENKITTNELKRRNNTFQEVWNVTLPETFGWVVENNNDNGTLVYTLNRRSYISHLTYVNNIGTIRWQKQMGISYPIFGTDGDIYGSHWTGVKRISSETGEVIDSLNLLTPGILQCVDSDGAVYISSGNSIFAKYIFGDYLTIRDAHNDSIPDTEFELYRVANDPPYFTEEFLGKFTTDGKWRLEYATESEDSISVELAEGTRYLYDGDMFKVTRQLHNEPAIRHTSALKTMYSIHPSNLKFDDQGIVSFNKVGDDNWSDVVMDHTEIRYNLMVSIEWDADQEYHYGVQKDFRAMSNYLYDVTDGQLRLDTVMVFDNNDWWHYADVRIRASNMHHPDAVSNAIYVQNAYPINMPRKWLADIPGNQQMTHDHFPFNGSYPLNYRTLAHEFGHFALNFLDEYLFVNAVGDSIPAFVRCLPRPQGNYGFMDYQYPDQNGGVMASEMSSSYRYMNPACQNTRQFVFNLESCWDYFEHQFEKEYDGIFAPIRKPDIADETERLTPGGLDHFPGPNNDLLSLDYDIGRKVVFTEDIVAPAPLVGSRLVLVDNVAAGGVNVKLDIDDGTGNLTNPEDFCRTVDQGNTTDLGLLWVLGVNPLYDNVIVTGHSWNYTGGPVALLKSHALSEVQKQWLYAR